MVCVFEIVIVFGIYYGYRLVNIFKIFTGKRMINDDCKKSVFGIECFGILQAYWMEVMVNDCSIVCLFGIVSVFGI